MLSLHLHLDKSPGLGHQRRLLAIAQEWMNRGGKTERFLNKKPVGPAVHLFDGYSFGNDEFTTAKKTGGLTVVIDEKDKGYKADLVFVPALLKIYRGFDNYLYGPEYFPLRESFKQIPVKPDDGEPVQLDEIFYCDSVGRSMHPNTFSYRMAQSKVIVCSAGITAYESLYLGKPTLLRYTAENQKANFLNLIGEGYALPFRDHNPQSLDFDTRQTLGEKGRSLVDGHGSKRIVDKILEVVE